jgi:sialidase-1
MPTQHTTIKTLSLPTMEITTYNIGTSSGPNRNNLAIWSSLDEGVTFGTPHQLVYGMSAYSDIVTLNDGSIGIIYEATGSTLLKFINFELEQIQ